MATGISGGDDVTEIPATPSPRRQWEAYAGARAAHCRRVVNVAAGELRSIAVSPVRVAGGTDASWANGALGLSLLFAEIASQNDAKRWGSACLDVVVAAFQRRPLPSVPGLFAGPMGTAAALLLVSQDVSSLQRLADRAEEPGLRSAGWLRPSAERLSTHDFDLITGIAGALAYDHVRRTCGRVPLPFAFRQAWAAYLGEMARRNPPFKFQADEVAADIIASRDEGRQNLGVAHGLAGIAAAVWREPKGEAALDPSVPERLYAVVEDACLREDSPVVGRESSWAREAWCFGLAGIVAALAPVLRGRPRRRAWCDLLVQRATAYLGDLEGVGMTLDRLTFCHGLAGITHSVACATVCLQDAGLRKLRGTLFGRLLECSEAMLTPPFQHGDPSFLTGLGGIVAVLHAATANRWPRWNALCSLPDEVWN